MKVNEKQNINSENGETQNNTMNQFNTNKEDEENSNVAINNESQNNKSEKEDNNSDLSSLVNQKIDNQEMKIVKKIRVKKADFDRKSHLSHNIEGVIFEDINEDEEWEDKEKLNIGNTYGLNGYHKDSFEDNYHKDPIDLSNKIMKKYNQNKDEKDGYFSNNKNTNLNKSNNSFNENYFENINFNDEKNIGNFRSNSLNDNSKDEISNSKIMQDLLKHRNLPLNCEKRNEKEILGNDINSLKHSNSNPIPKSTHNVLNRGDIIKEKFISFENDNEDDSRMKSSMKKNTNKDLNEKINNIKYSKGNFYSNNDSEENNINNIQEQIIFNNSKFENIDVNKAKLNQFLERIKKEQKKDSLIKEIKTKIFELTNDEAEFYDVTKTIKFHKTSDKDVISKEIIQGNLKKILLKGEIMDSIISLSGLQKHEIEMNSKKKITHLNQGINTTNENENSSKDIKEFDNELNGVFDIIQGLNLPAKSEKLKKFINCKNSAFNLLTKSRYTESKNNRLKILNGIAFILIVIVFLIYYFYLREL